MLGTKRGSSRLNFSDWPPRAKQGSADLVVGDIRLRVTDKVPDRSSMPNLLPEHPWHVPDAMQLSGIYLHLGSSNKEMLLRIPVLSVELD